MRHLLQLMTSRPMLMTVESHQACFQALTEYYHNPQAFFDDEEPQAREESFCHLSVFGPTTHRFSGLDQNCRAVRSYRDIRDEVQMALDDPSVNTIFIEFDGPGGDAAGCFDTAEFITRAAGIKPVIGLINGSSFSANYALASACSELYATPFSSGGSVGVIYGREERTEEGRRITYFTSGEAKADGQPFTQLTEAEAKRTQDFVDELASQFFDVVARNRQITAEEARRLQASIYTAGQMLELGLIDGIKTEEEIKTMMTQSTHDRLVAELNAEHQAEVAGLQTQIQTLQTKVEATGKEQAELLSQVSALAKSAGCADMTADIVGSGATLEQAKEQIKQEAARRDEDISLTGSLADGSESYDMQQLIKDA